MSIKDYRGYYELDWKRSKSGLHPKHCSVQSSDTEVQLVSDIYWSPFSSCRLATIGLLRLLCLYVLFLSSQGFKVVGFC